MASNDSNPIDVDENTPLLLQKEPEAGKYGNSVLYLALLCGFLVSVSFGVTQVPMIYVFRLMTCDAYYQTHPEPANGLERCEVREIEAQTARAVSLLAASTTLFGVANLFVTGWTIKKFGVKTALLISVFWPAVRLAVQNLGVMAGGNQGILTLQLSQIITVLGGPAGYLLSLNSYVSEITESSSRTGALGKLQGCSFLGTASAYLAGGLISDYFGILAPFQVTLLLFSASCIYIFICLPRIPPSKEVPSQLSGGLAKFLGPLMIFKPQKWTLQNGQLRFEYGTMLLGAGVFLGVLATGYIPILLQMYGTDIFHFGTTENGYLISLNSFMRGLFLTLVFPKIISVGRTWMVDKARSKDAETGAAQTFRALDVPGNINRAAPIEPLDDQEEPIEPSDSSDERETFDFDLMYTRYSLLADALLTGAASFVSKGWQMYLISALLPFAAGTGAAAKGTILQMCSASERADALSAISLIEMVAQLTTSTCICHCGPPELVANSL
ncbi:hypothetical protein BP5796_11588 [Coleophoma crateriformis]|uniref:Major facilitator superfamily (MFS) profile domain-containing protein n=1 Tax=Coleophoma crateriformis TaxID=565419 RepID=A0A3D8QDQ9_9HELO|nr:hypothetical protein BP5796_11588 [Coleophoma crateriformis]